MVIPGVDTKNSGNDLYQKENFYYWNEVNTMNMHERCFFLGNKGHCLLAATSDKAPSLARSVIEGVAENDQLVVTFQCSASADVRLQKWCDGFDKQVDIDGWVF